MKTSTTKPIEILLIEDNPGDVLLTKEALHDDKVKVNLSVVSDGEEALTYLYRRGRHVHAPRPDLILLDLNLPRKDGREVLAQIKNDLALRRIHVVVLTTSETEEDIVKAYSLNANCYVQKPIDLEQFIKVVKSIESFWFTVVKLPESSSRA